jgi:hypothetical protein
VQNELPNVIDLSKIGQHLQNLGPHKRFQHKPPSLANPHAKVIQSNQGAKIKKASLIHSHDHPIKLAALLRTEISVICSFGLYAC